LQGSSGVLTSDGLIPIKELVGKVVNVWTGFKWSKAVGLNRGQCQLASIWLSSGLKINCDTRHKLKNEKNEWVDFKDLAIGQYVALPKNNSILKPYVAERLLEKNAEPDFEIYRYDTIEKIEILNKQEDTYTMSVQDNLHQFVADGVIHKNTAFHILLWTYIQINKIRREEGWRTKIPAEVHDSMMFDFHPKEVAHVIKTGKHIAEVETRKAFEWINIPIKIETELAPVGGSWNDLKPYEA
jgi:hypothetical protein